MPNPMTSSPAAPGTTRTTGSAPFTSDAGAMSVVTTVFFMWGLITVLNDILIPHLKSIFNLNYFQAMLIQFCFFSTYFVFAVPFGKLVENVGYKKTMVIGLCTSAVGALLFLPAALVASFPLFLGALIVLAAGITALQVSANPFVSILGSPATASSRLNLAQALNSLGTTIAPYLGGILILSAASAVKLTPVQQAHSVILPYVSLAGILFLLALGVALSKLSPLAGTRGYEAQNRSAESQSVEAQSTDTTLTPTDTGHTGRSIWSYKHTVLGALGIFLYVGAEVSIGSFLVNYFGQPDTGGLKPEDAAKLVAYYWGGAMVGRFIGSAVLQRVPAGRALGAVALAACVLVTASMLTTGHVAMATIIAVGLFNSIMFPNIFTLGIAGLGKLTGEGSGLLIAAIVGGALVPLAQGALADKLGIHHAFFLPVLCYLYVAYYGFRGSRPEATAA